MKRILVTVVLALLASTPATSVYAASAAEFDGKVSETIEAFKNEVSGAEVFLGQAAGYLVFPKARGSLVRDH